MRTSLLPDEVSIKDGVANLQQGIKTIGGRLYLTNRRLVFEPDITQTGFTEIPVNNIVDIQKCWTKFLNLIPLAPNCIAMSTKDGNRYRFVVFGRQKWIEAIEQQRR